MVIPANAWNEMLEALRWVKEQRGASHVQPAQHRDANTLPVSNETGENVPRFGIIKLSEPLIFDADDAAALRTFQNHLAMKAVKPVEGEAFAVLQEPMPENAVRIGTCAAAGVTVAKVNVTEDTEEFRCVKAITDDLEKLELTDVDGFGDLIWREELESLPGTAWAIVHLGNGPCEAPE